MSVKFIVDEILEALFERYIESHGTGRLDISYIAEKHDLDPHYVGNYLVEHGLVKNQAFEATGFLASISQYAIDKIRPDYFRNYQDKLLLVLGEHARGYYSIMQILEIEPQDFQLAFDIAKYIERYGYINANATSHDINVSITDDGVAYYNLHKPTFFSL
jgi:hypothetical protein